MATRPLIDTLRHLDGGCLMDDAAELMAELVKAVDSTGKAGKLTLEISVRRATKGAFAVIGKVTVKKPSEPVYESLLFPTPEGNLLTDDPSQHKLDLRPVSGVEKPALSAVNE